jgi:hypothetical protein
VGNDEEARHALQRGTMWKEDLVFHPDLQSRMTESLTQEAILRRYQAHFDLV